MQVRKHRLLSRSLSICLLALAGIFISAGAQTITPSEWIWMGGNSTVPCVNCGRPGVYGTLGVPDAANIPGGRDGASRWTGENNQLWLLGGYGTDANGNSGDLNDLWKFNPSMNNWTWMGGSKTVSCITCGQSGVYGTLGTPNPKGRSPGSPKEQH
jgi:hypothetical protein